MATRNGDTRTVEADGRTVDTATGVPGAPFDGLSRYDALLLVIPAVFLVALVVAQVSSVAVPTVMAGASVVGGLAVVDGLFLNPPR